MNPSTMRLSRKSFIKTFAVTTAYSTLLGKSWKSVAASEITASATTTGVLRVSLQAFPALQSDLGSVRIAINPVNGDTGPNGTFYPIIVNRGPNNAFFGLNSRCTHQGCIVPAMESSGLMTCPCHGSVYAIDGRRVSGLAPTALTKYTTSFDGADLVKVNIPNLGYSVTVAGVQPVTPEMQRLQLTFRSFRNVEYEVQFRESLSAAPVPVLFATTAAGPTDQTSIFTPTAVSTNLFVDSNSPAGFYSVAIRVNEV
jgi:Rieske Fe-S protein